MRLLACYLAYVERAATAELFAARVRAFVAAYCGYHGFPPVRSEIEAWMGLL